MRRSKDRSARRLRTILRAVAINHMSPLSQQPDGYRKVEPGPRSIRREYLRTVAPQRQGQTTAVAEGKSPSTLERAQGTGHLGVALGEGLDDHACRDQQAWDSPNLDLAVHQLPEHLGKVHGAQHSGRQGLPHHVSTRLLVE